MTIEELIKNMTDEEKEKFFEGFVKELKFWGNINRTEGITMDLFKKTNVVKATAYDYNASKVVTLRNRSKIAKFLNRYSRRKLKQDLKTDLETVFKKEGTV